MSDEDVLLTHSPMVPIKKDPITRKNLRWMCKACGREGATIGEINSVVCQRPRTAEQQEKDLLDAIDGKL